ncbi:MAG: hypothetical protein COT71_01345 [Candidatus Andersenbacteria bacterium CG10_big_fil_rev_8_21_14_0_10_54_11]|uniref:Resolvase/invertase-type recombinase catalytic domain-containing protein n=1 Tax=Candidatus Andersenbacteria bacterium CG10_big_fil_rev_8_21_14_0_10_54_11 TaxID=1974485 RepID=A0A2M6WZV5_9BACT|nr:MAG: hypothetical protein COT71_01345 [Candidatus Andersenbacteria bacterium CG10_big_fil_rev_8_21_14_0_10_54_11]
MKCVIYVRVSDQSQVDGTSLTTQTAFCKEYAEKRGLKVVRVFREEGKSAKTLNRPELQRMLEYIRSKKAGAVIVYDLSRFSRNLLNQLLARETIEGAGGKLLSVTKDLESEMGDTMSKVAGAFNEWENRRRAAKCRTGLIARFSEGYWVSTPPPGYDMVRGRDKRSRAVLNEMAPMIKWAFEKRAEGWTFKRIADGMNSRGYRSRHGRKIREQNVHHLIKNPRILEPKQLGSFSTQ